MCFFTFQERYQILSTTRIYFKRRRSSRNQCLRRLFARSSRDSKIPQPALGKLINPSMNMNLLTFGGTLGPGIDNDLGLAKILDLTLDILLNNNGKCFSGRSS